MKIIKDFDQGSEEWLEWRKGKATGTTQKSFVGYKELLKGELVKIAEANDIELDKKDLVTTIKEKLMSAIPGFKSKVLVKKKNLDIKYKYMAHQLSNGTAPELDPREYGHVMEPVIIEMFEKETKLKVETVGGLEREDEPRIAMSPDGIIANKKGIYSEAIEIKALAGWKHVKAMQEGKYPEEYIEQALSYFVVNDELEKLYFVMGCPEITIKPLLIFEIYRKDYEKEIETILEALKDFFKELDEELETLYF